MSDLKEYTLIRANQKTGQVNMQLEALGKAMLALWALQNTTKSDISIIAEKDSGLIIEKYIGTKSGFPEVHKHLEEEGEYLEVVEDESCHC